MSETVVSEAGSSGRIRWIVFDCVGTLITPDPPVHEAYARIGARHGSSIGADQIANRFRTVFRATEAEDREALSQTTQPDRFACRETSESIERRRWQRIVQAVIDDVDGDSCFEELFGYFGLPEAWRVFEDVSDSIQVLQRRGLQVAVASNFDARLHDVFDGLASMRDFSRRYVSSLIGFRKPDRRFYEHVISDLGCEPSEVLFVGDDRLNDFEGALHSGCRALHLVRDHQSAEPPSARPGDCIRSLSELTKFLT